MKVVRTFKFEEFKNSKNLIHYDLTKPDLIVFKGSTIIIDEPHWFYDANNDYIFKFNQLKIFCERDSLFREGFPDEPTEFFAYKDDTFSLIDPVREYEKLIILAVMERLKVLGMKSVEKFKIKPNEFDLQYKIKFNDTADLAFFKLLFHDNIHSGEE